MRLRTSTHRVRRASEGASAADFAISATATSYNSSARERIVARYPNDPDAYEVLARVEFWLGDPAEAVRLWQRCLEFDPAYSHAYHGMGLAAAKSGEHAKAVELFRKTLTLTPDSAEPWLDLAESLTSLGKTDEAVDALEDGLKTARDPAPLLAPLGKLYLQKKEYRQAQRAFEAVLRLRPDHPNALYGMATACARLGQTKKGQQYAAKFEKGEKQRRQRMKNRPDELDALRQELARAYVAAGEVCEGAGDASADERLCRRAVALAPSDSTIRENLAQMYQRHGRMAEALDAMEQLAAMYPEHPGYRIDIGRLHVALKQFGPAEKAFRRACELAPERFEGYLSLAQLYLQQNREPGKALSLAKKAAQLRPCPATYELLARASERGGDKKEAADAHAK